MQPDIAGVFFAVLALLKRRCGVRGRAWGPSVTSATWRRVRHVSHDGVVLGRLEEPALLAHAFCGSIGAHMYWSKTKAVACSYEAIEGVLLLCDQLELGRHLVFNARACSECR